MASLMAEYTYETQLPYMFILITEPKNKLTRKWATYNQKHSNGLGLSEMQRKLWATCWAMREKVNGDPEYCAAHAAIRQFTMEKWVWGKYWSGSKFPGKYPSRVASQAAFGTTNLDAPFAAQCQPAFKKRKVSSRPVSEYHRGKPGDQPNRGLHVPLFTEPIDYVPTPIAVSEYLYANEAPHLASNSICPLSQQRGNQNIYTNVTPYNTANAPLTTTLTLLPSVGESSYITSTTGKFANTAHPAELRLSPTHIDQYRASIFAKKGYQYFPQHGWDTVSGLPRYAVVCIAPNAFREWCGKGGEYFKVLQSEFTPFRLQWQGVGGGAVVIWPEAGTIELHEGGEAWVKFCQLWAFIRTWAEHGNPSGKAENAIIHMIRCRDEWLRYDTAGLTPPAAPGIGRGCSTADFEFGDAHMSYKDAEPVGVWGMGVVQDSNIENVYY